MRLPPRRARTVVVALLVGAATCTGLAGCSTRAGAAGAASAATTRAPHAGAYPIATPGPAVTSTPTVSAGGYQLVAAGDPVVVNLPTAQLLVTVSGPDVDVPDPGPGQPIDAPSAPGTLTITATAASGSAELSAASFLGLDEEQDPIALHPDATSLPVSPGHPATLHLASTFATGHTTLTWQPLGTPLITWDFTVEID